MTFFIVCEQWIKDPRDAAAGNTYIFASELITSPGSSGIARSLPSSLHSGSQYGLVRTMPAELRIAPVPGRANAAVHSSQSPRPVFVCARTRPADPPLGGTKSRGHPFVA